MTMTLDTAGNHPPVKRGELLLKEQSDMHGFYTNRYLSFWNHKISIVGQMCSSSSSADVDPQMTLVLVE